jgi:threonyl-tRNA synthetase
MQKIPFMVIAGEEDMNAGAVSFRYRNGDQKNGIPIADAIAEIKQIVADRKQV